MVHRRQTWDYLGILYNFKQIISVHKGSGRNSRGGEQWIITYLSQWPNGKGKEKQKKIEKITRSLTQEGCSNRPSNRKVHN